MAKHEIISGQKSVWQVQFKTGEGDAGEIFQVASMMGTQVAYLKRPAMSAFRGDVFRQSSQIRTEARILTALNKATGFDQGMKVSVPRLLDQSKPGPEYNEGNFIIIEKAEGLDLGLLARSARKGLAEGEEVELAPTAEGRALLQGIARDGKIPDLLLADILMRLAHYLDFIHHLESEESGKPTQGIVWNDVKADHLFYDPAGGRLTVIDWGNASFLEMDQTTVNRQFSWMDDFKQFFDEMGKFMEENSPELINQLGWKDFSNLKTIPPRSIEEIKTRLSVTYRQLKQSIEGRDKPGKHLKKAVVQNEISAEDIEKYREQAREFGGQPGEDDDQSPESWLRYLTTLAANLAAESRLADFQMMCRWAAGLPGGNPDYWNLLDLIAGLAAETAAESRGPFMEILHSAIEMDWEDTLWKSASVFQDDPPEWWPELALAARRLALGKEDAAVRPLEGVWRIYYTLQARLLRNPDGSEVDPGEGLSPTRARELMKQITNEIVPGWTMREPTPPDSRLDYRPAMQVVDEILTGLPEKDRGMAEVFAAPSSKMEEVLAHWENKNFPAAAGALREVLLWDPDRLRVLQAEKHIRESVHWLDKVQSGPPLDGNYPTWISEVEFQAAELRSIVGPAGWLELIQDACRLLSRGYWPADLVKEKPGFMTELPWLASFDRREKTPGLTGEEIAALNSTTVFDGVEEAGVGLNEALTLVSPLDTWAAEARGSSARVVSGLLKIGGETVAAAVKLMRIDQVHYAQPLFREEAVILSRMADVPGVARMIECGFFRLEEGSEFPLQPGYGHPPAEGRALRIAPDKVEEFIGQLEDRIHSGWTPYLAVERQEQEDNLLYACDAGQTRGQYQPTLKLLKMAVQICDVLETAHQRGIVYRDHKILHYYWFNPDNRMTVIDWNVARFHEEGLRQSDIEMDIVQFGARGLHHILTGRTAPGALPLGPTRPEEIEAAAHTYKTHWTYDDARLPRELQEILERVLSGGYTSIPALRDDLKATIIKKPAYNSIPADE